MPGEPFSIDVTLAGSSRAQITHAVVNLLEGLKGGTYSGLRTTTHPRVRLTLTIEDDDGEGDA